MQLIGLRVMLRLTEQKFPPSDRNTRDNCTEPNNTYPGI